VKPMAVTLAKSCATLRSLWYRSLQVRGVRGILLATIPPALRALRRLRSVPRARPRPLALVDVLVSPERFVPEFQSDAPWAEAHLERYRFAAERLLPTDSVLDAACGSGYGTAILSHSCKRAAGIDKSRATIAYAREKYGGPFYVRDLLRRPLPACNYDVVVSFETIEHIEAPLPKVLHSLARRARRMVIGSVPYLENGGNSFHHHFHLQESHLRTLERYGSVTYYFQEPEPGCRIHSHPLSKTQNLIFVLALGGSSWWTRCFRAAWKGKKTRPLDERVAPVRITAPNGSPQVRADNSSSGAQADSSRTSGAKRETE
jgi:SAM-dependent methyltransferase